MHGALSPAGRASQFFWRACLSESPRALEEGHPGRSGRLRRWPRGRPRTRQGGKERGERASALCPEQRLTQGTLVYSLQPRENQTHKPPSPALCGGHRKWPRASVCPASRRRSRRVPSRWAGAPGQGARPGAGPVPLNFLARRLSFEPVGDRRGNTSGQPRAPQSLQLFRDLLGLRRPWLSGFWGVAPPPPWGAGPPVCARSSSLPCSVVSAVLEEAPVLGTWQSQARQSTPLLRERG